MSSPSRPLITPARFIECWNSAADADPLLPVFPENIPSMETRRMPAESVQFMIEAGLPSDAAPFLILHYTQYGLIPLWKVFGREEDWNSERQAPLRRYGMLGVDGGGNPICVDEERNSCIMLLDYYTYDFQPDSFINSSIPQFAEFLLLYRTAWDRTLATENQEGRSDSDPATVRRVRIWLENEFKEIDPDAMAEGTMWYHEIAMFEENRL